MREVLFRGKSAETGKFVYGSLITVDSCRGDDWNGAFILPKVTDESEDFNKAINVISETAGQYSGFEDKNMRRIYEGDIVKVDGFTPNEYIIDFIEGGFCLVTNPRKGLPIDINVCYPSIGCIIEVIGNVHEVTP